MKIKVKRLSRKQTEDIYWYVIRKWRIKSKASMIAILDAIQLAERTILTGKNTEFLTGKKLPMGDEL